ncbi:hypothetical protein PLESTB_000995100 [Pleodorina starrii]|uniref:Uncharacterized protein n=1 Tax=Pleodorina starrii TaxID=330485 RepID=A0A9W6BP20_9CHLO|nr:hypothetical protein PLESTM_001854100 [Pleodorina starrii]GLC55508.1 hypothetical protein PLESTB_000995100 [Pleodorina starrii]
MPPPTLLRRSARVGSQPQALIAAACRHSSKPAQQTLNHKCVASSGPATPPCGLAQRRCAVRLADPGALRCVATCASPSAVQLVSAAAVPVAKVALFCAVGAWAASRGLLSPEGRRVISSLTLHIFTPCLLFSKLAVGVGLQEVVRLWLLSANIVASHVVGLLLGLLAVRAGRAPYRLRNQLVLSCGVGNVGNLPFVLLAGLAADPALPFAAALGPVAAGELAMRYVALSNLSAALIQFPLTYIFMQKPSSTPTPTPAPVPESLPAGSCDEVDNAASTSTSSKNSRDGDGGSPDSSTSTTSSSTSSGGNEGGRWRSVVAGVCSPPTLASLAAVVVASVGWLRDALFSPGGCLRLVGEVSDALGAVCIPALLLVLGANLSRGPGVAAGRLPGACVAAAVATRLVLLPAVCGAALLGAWRAGLLPAGTDPLAMLVMFIMHATPTAVLVHSMATIFSNAEDEVAALLFWQYIASLVSLPLAIGLMLQLLAPAAAAPGAWLGSAVGPVAAAVV